MKDIEQILYSLGFLDSEVKTYLTSLHRGPSTVLEITKHTGLSRQVTYVVIEALTNRGIMSSVLRGKKKYYVAEDPEKLLSYAHRKEQEMRDHLADLERILPEMKLKVGGEKPIVKLFEGKEGYRTIIADIEQSGCKEIEEILDRTAKNAVISQEENRNLLAGLIKKKIRVKGLYAGASRGTFMQFERYQLPENQEGFRSCIVRYGDRVAFFTYEGKLYSVVIENKALAAAVGVLFDRAFQGAHDLPHEVGVDEVSLLKKYPARPFG